MQLQNPQYVCECGYSGPLNKFCPECGKQVKAEEKEFTCPCGYISKGANFCPNCGHRTGLNPAPDSAANAVTTPGPTAPAESEEKEEILGWKCPQCGLENQDYRCSACGAAIIPVVLFSISTYASTNPPVSTCTTVYEYSDTQLLLENNDKRRLISVNVIEPAMEIIRENRLDDPDSKDPSAMGIMGGSVNVGFKCGDKFILTSLQTHGFVVTKVHSELMELFNKAK